MVAFAGTVNWGVATRSTFAGPVHDNSDVPEFVMQAGGVVVEELGDVPPDPVASEVVVEEDDDVPADLVEDPPIVSASTTATATTTLGTA
jgi:hypothetical protein